MNFLITLLSFLLLFLHPIPAQVTSLEPNYTSPLGVKIYNPSQSFRPTGPWSLMSSVQGTLYVAGMRGVHPSNSSLVAYGEPRVRQAYQNMADLVRFAGGEITSCLRLVVYVTDMYRWRPVVNQITEEFWGDEKGRYCPRSIVEVQRLNDDDIVEVEGTFWLGQPGA
jgi:enamine deaminase RidA (YjgF/YER057c/UK114 family)